MTNRNYISSFLLVLIAAMAFIVSCSTTDTANNSAMKHGAGTPRIVTVLQVEDWPNAVSAVALIKSYATDINLDIQFERVIVKTDADVQKHKFLGSPTVRIKGLDVEPSARSSTQYGFTWRLLDWTQGASATRMMLHNAFKEAGWVS